MAVGFNLGKKQGQPRTYCNPCGIRLQRNGDVNQDAVAAHKLKPYIAEVERLLKGQRGDAVRAYFDQIWSALIGHAQETLEECLKRPSSRYLRQAAEEVIRVAPHATGTKVGTLILAAFMAREEHPKLYETDKSFKYQLGRLITNLVGHTYYSSRWDDEKQVVKKAWKTTPGRTREQLGIFVLNYYGPVAGNAIGFVRAKERARLDAHAAATDAFREITNEVYVAEFNRQLELLKK